MKKIIDISMAIYQGQKSHTSELATIERVLTPDKEKSFGRTTSKYSGSLHKGTHIDAPLHMLGSKAKRICDYPLEKFMGEGVMADMRHKVPGGDVSGEDLEKSVGKIIREGDILLIRADMSKDWGSDKYFKDSPKLTPDGAKWCIDKKVKLVGRDHKGLSGPPFTSSRLLFENDILTMDYLDNLGEISSERFTVIAFPIKIEDVEASFVRAVVIES